MKLHRGITLLLASVLGAGILAGTARAERGDASSSGAHLVHHEVFLDLGRYVDLVPWTYVVREGDTLGEIAQQELGSARRHTEILALNPGLSPRSLHATRPIVMPPRDPGAGERSSWYVFFVHTPDPRGWAAPRRLGDGPLHRLGHGARVCAVPYEHLPALLAASRDAGRVDGAKLVSAAGVACSDPVTLVSHLPDTEPSHRIVTLYRLDGIEGERVELTRVGEDHYDADGRRLAGPVPPRDGPSLALLVLAFLALAGALGAGIRWAGHAGALEPPLAPEAEAGGDAAGDDDAEDAAEDAAEADDLEA